MATIEALLGDAPPPRVPYIIRPHRPGDIGWVISRHGALYAEEYGWDETFEGFVARDGQRASSRASTRSASAAGSPSARARPWAPSSWCADPTRAPPSCACCTWSRPPAAWASARRLVEECRLFARPAGYARIVLWTNSILTSARRIYEAAGYRLVKSEPHRSFGQDLVGETWELDLGR